jgi:5-methylcytosine-specific restriction protein A
MPYAQRRPCAVRGCGELTPCPVHARAPLYNRQGWRKRARAFLRAHPFCVVCRRRGRITLATDVDHVIDHEGNETLFWDSGNWQALCAGCHSRKTRGR